MVSFISSFIPSLIIFSILSQKYLYFSLSANLSEQRKVDQSNLPHHLSPSLSLFLSLSQSQSPSVPPSVPFSLPPPSPSPPALSLSLTTLFRVHTFTFWIKSDCLGDDPIQGSLTAGNSNHDAWACCSAQHSLLTMSVSRWSKLCMTVLWLIIWCH